MATKEKSEQVEELCRKMSGATSLYLADFTGLDVASATQAAAIAAPGIDPVRGREESVGQAGSGEGGHALAGRLPQRSHGHGFRPCRSSGTSKDSPEVHRRRRQAHHQERFSRRGITVAGAGPSDRLPAIQRRAGRKVSLGGPESPVRFFGGPVRAS